MVLKSVALRRLTCTSHQLSSKRRVNVSKFNKALLINIREYYEAGGELKPGKKVWTNRSVSLYGTAAKSENREYRFQSINTRSYSRPYLRSTSSCARRGTM